MLFTMYYSILVLHPEEIATDRPVQHFVCDDNYGSNTNELKCGTEGRERLSPQIASVV